MGGILFLFFLFKPLYSAQLKSQVCPFVPHPYAGDMSAQSFMNVQEKIWS